ncbi:MAG: hypothetical protein IPJ38_05840 [Dechloromonas sp.]|uniref:Uncharacterized protein n=1 Tax=Candidatus Dechloromonas phosphorivorans TaxID=2899244 RepID=A0A935JVR1_9RHOO|nr:hypothetical protein [Candidatus Dechloromonas phosphorivorans]
MILSECIIGVEIKQLDENDDDKLRNSQLGQGKVVGGSGLRVRLRRQIASGYGQLKRYAREGAPSLLVIYNNSGLLNFIDSFSITTAMFGSFGVRFGIDKSGTVDVTGQGFIGNRKLTRNECRKLSAIAVLKESASSISLDVYHNPFADIPLEPCLIRALADAQFIHPNPHSGQFVELEPAEIQL